MAKDLLECTNETPLTTTSCKDGSTVEKERVKENNKNSSDHSASATDFDSNSDSCSSSDSDDDDHDELLVEQQQQQQEQKEEDEEDNIPSEFLCPLTLEMMKDPVMDKQGINFERRAIVQWLGTGRTTHPLTRQPLTFSKLVPNVQLRLKIQQWKKDHSPATTAGKSIYQCIDEEEDDDDERLDSSSSAATGPLQDGIDHPQRLFVANSSNQHRDVQMSFLGMIEAPPDSSMYDLWTQQIARAMAIEAGLLPPEMATNAVLPPRVSRRASHPAPTTSTTTATSTAAGPLSPPPAANQSRRKRRLRRVLKNAFASLRGSSNANQSS